MTAGHDEYEEEWSEEYEIDEVRPSLLSRAIDHPRLTLGGGSLLLSLVVDVAVRFDSFAVILGLGAALAIGWKGDDLAKGAIQMFVPGADQEQARESADHFADRLIGDYPVYADQRPAAKLKRLFRIEQGEVVDALPKNIPPPKRGEVRTPRTASVSREDLIYMWFEEGKITVDQFWILLERESNPKLSPSGESVKRPPKPGEIGESAVKVHPEGEMLSPEVSPEDEQAIIRTAFTIQQVNGRVTREDIKTALQWNNKKHWVVKAVCDKYGIGGK